MPLPYVEQDIKLTPGLPKVMNLEDAISVFRALVGIDCSPVLRRMGDDFEITIGLGERALLGQLVEVEAAAKKASPDVRCFLENGALAFR